MKMGAPNNHPNAKSLVPLIKLSDFVSFQVFHSEKHQLTTANKSRDRYTAAITIPSKYFVSQRKLLPNGVLALCDNAARNSNAKNRPPK